MAASNDGLLSPLQLEAGYGILKDSANVFQVAPSFQAQVASYQSTLVGSLHTVLGLANTAGLSTSTIQDLQTIGDNTIPALGDSTPLAYQNTNYPVPVFNTFIFPIYNGQPMFSGRLIQIGNIYLGNGNAGKMAQIIFAAKGYTDIVNVYIQSARNANGNNYLGPTYNQASSGIGNMDNLITGDMSKLTVAFPDFAADLLALGKAIDLGNLENLGTPAALLQQLAKVTGIRGTLPCVETALTTAGLTNKNITDLVFNNKVSATNVNGLTDNEFNSLQRLAYIGMENVAGDCLDQVLTALDVTTPNITQMSDLLNPEAIFPLSYFSFAYAGPYGPELIWADDGSVNQILFDNGPTGCEELGKIIPPSWAVANRAIGSTWAQVKNISQVSLAELAAALA